MGQICQKDASLHKTTQKGSTGGGERKQNGDFTVFKRLVIGGHNVIKYSTYFFDRNGSGMAG